MLVRLGDFFFIDTYSVSEPESFNYLRKNTSARTWRVIFKFFQFFNPSSRNIPYLVALGISLPHLLISMSVI
ncbi:hypothetical protein RP29_11515 [Acidovorax temperans]|uniref:Uncharacterized protein n=1 Tax=Acidovorax temperans TaxID=80878 RepID=A0A0D7K7L4_9BURK|nr:hypothetical protein RP29_11515 [Acidovorax temperans]